MKEGSSCYFGYAPPRQSHSAESSVGGGLLRGEYRVFNSKGSGLWASPLLGLVNTSIPTLAPACRQRARREYTEGGGGFPPLPSVALCSDYRTEGCPITGNRLGLSPRLLHLALITGLRPPYPKLFKILSLRVPNAITIAIHGLALPVLGYRVD